MRSNTGLIRNASCIGANPLPPKAHHFVADVDSALMQQIPDVSNDSGYFTYTSAAKRITSGDELRHRNGLGDFARHLRLIAAPLSQAAKLL